MPSFDHPIGKDCVSSHKRSLNSSVFDDIALFRAIYLILSDISALVEFFLFLFFIDCKRFKRVRLVVREYLSRVLRSVYPQGVVTSPRS